MNARFVAFASFPALPANFRNVRRAPAPAFLWGGACEAGADGKSRRFADLADRVRERRRRDGKRSFILAGHREIWVQRPGGLHSSQRSAGGVADHVEQGLAVLPGRHRDRAGQRRRQLGRVLDPLAVAARRGADLLEGGQRVEMH